MMGERNSDGWTSTEADSGPDAAADQDDGAVSSLTSVQIRRAPKRPVQVSKFAPQSGPGSSAPKPENPVSPAREHPAAPGNAPEAQRPATAAQKPEDIMSYWRHLRGNRSCPAASELDGERIASDWPNSVLFRCRSGSNALEPDKTFGGQTGRTSLSLEPKPGHIEMSPMMLQWLLSLAGEVVRNRQPVEDTEAFPSLKRSVGYRAVALPLSEDHSAIDHVLCHVSPA